MQVFFIHFLVIAFTCLLTTTSKAQTNYSDLANWAFHPNKPSTLIDGFNLNIAIINENLQITSVVEVNNNAMRNTGVDVFFIHPTILLNIASYTTIENIPIANQNSNLIQQSIRGQIGLLAKYGRLYAPRYRQATPPTFINSPLDANQATVMGIAYKDVKDAFLNYLTVHNKGNKIIIASHSQGAYLAGFLLRDVFDTNPELRKQLVVAVVAGVASNYVLGNALTGGWWQNIPFCSQQNECGCVINWRTFKAGLAPSAPQASHPALNTFVVNDGLVYSQLSLPNSKLSQDSLYYNNQVQPLQNFITLRSNVNFGGNVGYVAFDGLYSIRHQRTAYNRVGFVLQHTPKPNDLRPDFLLEEEANPLFATLGYHIKDYNIYTWALLKLIDSKLAACSTIVNTTTPSPATSQSFTIYPNPATEWITVKINQQIAKNEMLSIYDMLGKFIISIKTNSVGAISISAIQNGVYVVKCAFGTTKLIVCR